MRPAYKDLNLMRKFERKSNAAHFRGDSALDELLTARRDHHCRRWNERNRKIAAAKAASE